jgi:hypothetical protein
MGPVDKRDPIEDALKFKEILAQADEAAEEELEDEPHGLGFCHVFWATKKRILKTKYGIDWKSPAEMNPNVDFE